MSSFRRTRRGVVVTFDEVEASLLRHLVGEVRDLLDDSSGAPPRPVATESGVARPGGAVPDPDELAAMTGLGGPAPVPPTDPVLARLLPDGYRDDPASSGEFRRFTEPTLRQQKLELIDQLLADLPGEGGGQVRLDATTTERWLATLNDVRLALGTRLDVSEEMAEPDPDDPDTPAYVVYLWLTELQDVLVQVASEG